MGVFILLEKRDYARRRIEFKETGQVIRLLRLLRKRYFSQQSFLFEAFYT